MKKTMSFIALFTVVLLSLSAHNGRVFEAAEGYSAPLFTLTKGDSARVSLADMKGRYVLVNFWSSIEPLTRVSAREYDLLARRVTERQLCLISVNTDRSYGLFREIAARDGLSEPTQWHVGGSEAERLIDVYNMRNGLGAFLIDPQGRIVAVNPTPKRLTALMQLAAAKDKG